jgi:hypothetical protein
VQESSQEFFLMRDTKPFRVNHPGQTNPIDNGDQVARLLERLEVRANQFKFLQCSDLSGDGLPPTILPLPLRLEQIGFANRMSDKSVPNLNAFLRNRLEWHGGVQVAFESGDAGGAFEGIVVGFCGAFGHLFKCDQEQVGFVSKVMRDDACGRTHFMCNRAQAERVESIADHDTPCGVDHLESAFLELLGATSAPSGWGMGWRRCETYC